MYLYERSQDPLSLSAIDIHSKDCLIDPLNFETLILELRCNYPAEKINEKTVYKQFLDDLSQRIEQSRDMLNICMVNIIKQARREV